MRRISFALAAALGLMASSAQAGMSVTWVPPGNTTVTGDLSGTLGAATIAGSTDPIGPNSGWVYSNNELAFNIGAGTAPAVAAIGGINGSATVIGLANPGPTTQSFTSTIALVNPILFFNFIDPTDVYDFSGLTINLLSSNNANLVGTTVTATNAASNTANDGFAVELIGSFTAFSFTAASSLNDGSWPGQTNGFTIAVRTIPEPTSVVSAILGVGALGLVGYRRRKAQA